MPILNTLVKQEENCSLFVSSTSSGLITNSIPSSLAPTEHSYPAAGDSTVGKCNRIPVIVAANDHNKWCSFGVKSGHRYVRKLQIVGCHSLLLLWSNLGSSANLAQVVLVLSSSHCGQTWKTLFWTSKKQTNCAIVPDHGMQAVLGSHN